MEDTLRALNKELFEAEELCLNPCSNGRYSQSYNGYTVYKDDMVLILVLMEDTLRVKKSSGRRSKKPS